MLEAIHVAEGVAHELAQQHAHGPAVHANEHQFIIGPALQQLDKRALARRYLGWAFTAGQVRVVVAGQPLI